MENLLKKTANYSLSFLDSLESRAVGVSANPDQLKELFNQNLPEQGIDSELVIDEIVEAAEPGLMGTQGGRFFGWVIGGAHPAALAADWLVATWDQNAALYASSPAASIVEEIASDWLKELLGIPRDASTSFVTGCQQAHFTCLAAARNYLLNLRGIDVERTGLFDAPKVHIVTSKQRHESILRAARFLGFGADSICHLTSGQELDLDELEATLVALKNDPTILVLQAGDINSGAFDPFDEACDIARKYGAWVHVDGAFGLWANASPQYAHLLRGCENADSWATDGHKWLNLPFDSGFAFVKNSRAHKNAMTIEASYLISGSDQIRDQINWNPEWSRRARGFPVYAALRSLGRSGVRDLIERCCEYTKQIVEGLKELDGVEVLSSPIINQALVRFTCPNFSADRFTDDVIEKIQMDGRTWFGGTTWNGMRAMRISVCNWRTTEEDVEVAIEAVSDASYACHDVCASSLSKPNLIKL